VEGSVISILCIFIPADDDDRPASRFMFNTQKALNGTSTVIRVLVLVEVVSVDSCLLLVCSDSTDDVFLFLAGGKGRLDDS